MREQRVKWRMRRPLELQACTPEVDSLNRNVGSRPQVNLRSRAPVPGRHSSGCTPRPIAFKH